MVKFGRCVAFIIALADTVNLVVDRSTMVITHLTGTADSPLDVGRMPGTNTSNLSKTLVGLARKLLSTPTAGDTLETVALGDGNAVDHLILFEDGIDLNGLLKETMAELDLVGNRTTVDLDLHQMGLLLLERRFAHLGMSQDTDDGAVLLDAFEIAGDVLAAIFGVLLGVFGESLLLALVPVLVESSLDLFRQVFSPHSGQRAESARSFDVANQTHNHHL